MGVLPTARQPAIAPAKPAAMPTTPRAIPLLAARISSLGRPRCHPRVRLPFTTQNGVNADRGPFVLEPVGFQHARLASKTQAFEEALNTDIAIVRLGVDPMEAVVLEQRGHDGGKRLAGQPAALMLWRESHADFCRPGLIVQDAYGAIAA